jgi:hypothetical protein
MKTKELKILKSFSPCEDALIWAKGYKTLQDAWNACQRSDWMMWWLKKPGTDKKISVQLAVLFVERVLPVYEAKYPNDDRPRKAIAAAKRWLDDPTEDNRLSADAAAADAAAAYAANAASAAAYAAASAANAAYAAADASGAYAAYASAASAASAAYAYAAYASAAYAAERAAQCDIIRSLIPDIPMP